MEQVQRQTNESIFSKANLLAALSPILFLMGTVVFPFFGDRSLSMYGYDFLPSILWMIAFTPPALCYLFGVRKLIANLSILFLPALVIMLVILDVSLEVGLIEQHIESYAVVKAEAYKDAYTDIPTRVELFDHRWGLGAFCILLATLLLPLSLYAPKYQRKENIVQGIKGKITVLQQQVRSIDFNGGIRYIEKRLSKVIRVSLFKLLDLKEVDWKTLLVKRRNQIVATLLVGVIVCLSVFDWSVAPDTEEVKTYIQADLKESDMYASFETLDIRDCEEVRTEVMQCVVDATIIVKTMHDELVAESRITNEVLEYQYTYNSFSPLRSSAYMSESAKEAIGMKILKHALGI